MTDKLDQAQSIFEEFVESNPAPNGSAVAAFLDQRCGQDDELRALVFELVENFESGVTGFLSQGAPRMDSGPTSPAGAIEMEAELGLTFEANLGEGAHGEVYRALDKALNRPVAVKVIKGDAIADPQKRARFLQEARLVASLDHENIVRIHSVDESDGQVRLVLEFIEGQTLHQALQQSGRLSPTEAAQVGIALCRALSAMHGQGVMHLDIKPSNVMRARGGRIVLLDFGVARSSDGETGSPIVVGGTPLFMAPEQLDPNQGIDARTDLYALGVMLYNLVSMQYPFEASQMAELISKKVEDGQAKPLLDHRPNVPAAFSDIVHRALEKDPADRFQSAGEMAKALRSFLAAGELEASTATATSEPVASSSRSMIALLAAALVITPLVWWQVNREPDTASGASMVPKIEASLLVGSSAEGQVLSSFRALGWDDTIREGDDLVIELQLEKPAYVYVFNLDTSGSVAALFPDPETDLKNPIAAGTNVRLPGFSAGTQQGWEMFTVPEGRDYFVLVTSPGQDPDAEDLLRELPNIGSGQFNQLSASSRDILTRGVKKKKAIDTSTADLGADDLQRLIQDLFGQATESERTVRRGDSTWTLLSVKHAD